MLAPLQSQPQQYKAKVARALRSSLEDLYAKCVGTKPQMAFILDGLRRYASKRNGLRELALNRKTANHKI